MKGQYMRIPVVFATDKNYLFFVCVAITSMARNAKADTFYQIYILVNSEFADSEHLLDKVQRRYSNVHIEMIYVDEAVFQDVTIHNMHVTKATFYRLALCDLIAEDKCIYLDGDILVTEDLGEVYRTDLGDYYLAGCRDIWIDLLTEEGREKRRIETGIPSMGQYVNAGVLLFHLKQLKKDGMNRTFVEELKRDHPYEDQDILNICCYDKIIHLPAKWNLFTLLMGQMRLMEEKGISESVLDAYDKKSGIIHYATPLIRPWERKDSWLSRLWWQTAEEWKNESVFQEIKNRVQEKEEKTQWDYYVDRCRGYGKVVIFGFTECGRRLCDWIKNIKEVQTIVFCDSDPLKQGSKYRDIPVFSLEEAMYRKASSKTAPALFIIASQTRAGEIQEFLNRQGICKKQIEAYKQKDESYYLYLDEDYYMKELQDICKREAQNWSDFEFLSLREVQEKLMKEKRYQDWKNTFHLNRWILKE